MTFYLICTVRKKELQNVEDVFKWATTGKHARTSYNEEAYDIYVVNVG